MKRDSHKINYNLPCENPDKPQNTICLPYIPKITRNLKKVCTQNNLYVVFTNNFKIINLLNSGKDRTPVTRQRGVNQIPCDCGKFYIGRTHQNFEKRLQQHKDDITKGLLFEESAIISNDLGIKQVVREAIEIRLKINNNICLNRDLGEYSYL